MEEIIAFVIGIIVGSGTTAVFIFLGFIASRVSALSEFDELSPVTGEMVDKLVDKVNESIEKDKEEEPKS